MSAATSPTRQSLSEEKLVQAASVGEANIVKLLITGGADVNASTQHGMTALMTAAQKGHLEVVSLLLDLGADINVERRDGFNALALATFFGHVLVVRELIGRGANVESKDRSGSSAETWATVRGFHEIADMLKAASSPHYLRERLNDRIVQGGNSSSTFAAAPEGAFRETHSRAVPPQDENLSNYRDHDEWKVEVNGSVDSSEQTIETSPARMWSAEEDNERHNSVTDNYAEKILMPPDAVLEQKFATVMPGQSDQRRALLAENQLAPVYNTPLTPITDFRSSTAYQKLEPFLAHITSGWRRLTILTLLVMLASGVGTFAFLSLLTRSINTEAARPGDIPDSYALNHGQVPDEFVDGPSSQSIGTASPIKNIKRPGKQIVASEDSGPRTRVITSMSGSDKQSRRSSSRGSLSQLTNERSNTRKGRQDGAKIVIEPSVKKRVVQKAQQHTPMPLANASAKPAQGSSIVTASETSEKGQPVSTVAPLSIEARRPRSVSEKNGFPSNAQSKGTSKSKVIQWP